MRRFGIAVATLGLLATSCVVGSANERTILVDFSSDQYPSFFLYNFPKKVAAHPGTTLVFRQTWTGEPHTVTGGRLTSKILATARPLLDLGLSYESLLASGADLPDPESSPPDLTFTDFTRALAKAEPRAKREQLIDAYNELREQGMDIPPLDEPSDKPFAEATKAIDEAGETTFEKLPFAFGEESDDLNQAVSQPCYLRSGRPPDQKPCTDRQQRQTEFDGTQSFYNSGIIRYQGQQGNTFRIPLADDIKPGSYTFYCAIHGPLQATEVEVRPESEEIPSQGELSRESRREIDAISEPLNEVWSDARDGRITLGSGEEETTVRGPFAGLFSPKEDHAAINAFVPQRLRVKVGQPIRWKIMGAEHTITFDVPRYFPPVQFLRDGTVRLNPKLDPPAGGAPKLPDEENVEKIDGGTYDGDGFWSSGLAGACPECGGPPYIEYTVRIAKPGTYKYACLLHPPMVGTVVVTG